MFSQLTQDAFRVFFTYFTWNTPFEWNRQTREIRVSTNSFKLARWKFILGFLCFYTTFVIIRSIQSFYSAQGINDIILHVPHLGMFLLNTCLEFTVFYNSDKIAFAFNQMFRNNTALGGYRATRRRDGLGIVAVFYIIGTILGPQISACFFFFNRHESNFLYSLVDTTNQTESVRLFVFLVFLSVELATLQCLANTTIMSCLILCTYYTHARYWLTHHDTNPYSALSNYHKYMKFQLFRIHTTIFNVSYAKYGLAPAKDVNSALLVMTAFALIRYHSQLTLGSILLLVYITMMDITGVVTVFYPAGWVWQFSTKVKGELSDSGTHVIEKQRQRCLRPFGVMIGSLYVMKSHSVLSLYNIILSNICTLLIAFK